MPRVFQPNHPPVRPDGGTDAVDFKGILRLGENDRQIGQHTVVQTQVIGEGGDRRRQLGENAVDLVLFAPVQLADAVVQLEDVQRLDKQRAARRGGVVHDALDLALVLGLDGDDETAVADGDQPLCKYFA